jgi:hypothetical protein
VPKTSSTFNFILHVIFSLIYYTQKYTKTHNIHTLNGPKQICLITGWLNSVAGIVKTYIRSRFDREQHQNTKENEKLKSLASVSPIPPASTNPFAQSPPNPITATLKSSQLRQNSPDPPPRTSRGSQSPLILRRKLELASNSPHLGNR